MALLGLVVDLGGDISDEEGNPTINTPEMEEAMQALVDIQEEGLMTPNGEDGYAMFQGTKYCSLLIHGLH